MSSRSATLMVSLAAPLAVGATLTAGPLPPLPIGGEAQAGLAGHAAILDGAATSDLLAGGLFSDEAATTGHQQSRSDSEALPVSGGDDDLALDGNMQDGVVQFARGGRFQWTPAAEGFARTGEGQAESGGSGGASQSLDGMLFGILGIGGIAEANGSGSLGFGGYGGNVDLKNGVPLVPLPAPLGLAASGLAGVLLLRRRLIG